MSNAEKETFVPLSELKEKFGDLSQPTPESVAVAFGEWLRNKEWQDGTKILFKQGRYQELFTLFTHSPEYKALNK